MENLINSNQRVDSNRSRKSAGRTGAGRPATEWSSFIYLLSFILILLISSQIKAQNFILYGDKAFGSDNQELGVQAIYDGNGSFIVTGRSNGNISGNKTQPLCDSSVYTDLWIIKIDTALNLLWDRDLGGTGLESNSTIRQKNNSQFVVAVSSNSDSSCNKLTNHIGNLGSPQPDYWLVTYDMSGNIVSQQTYGGALGEGDPEMIPLQSGNFIICGTSGSLAGYDKTNANYDTIPPYSSDYWVIKTDSNGNKLWDKIYGGSNYEYSRANNTFYVSGFNLLSESYDNFIIAGCTNSPSDHDISDTSRGQGDIWIIKLDSSGTKIWDRRIGGSENDVLSRMIHTQDKGYILCGATSSPPSGEVSDSSKGGQWDGWVIKLDSLGNKIWDKRYGGNERDFLTFIDKAPGGGYWISGHTYSDSSGDVSEPRYSIVGSDYWIIKIDEYGNKLWDKRFGGPGANLGSTFIIMSDSSIYLFGDAIAGTSAVKTDSGVGKSDYWVVHFKYTDSIYLSGVTELSNFSNNVSVFPNPTKDYVTIKSQAEKIKSVELINLLGETIYTQPVTYLFSIKFNLQTFPQGFYFVKIIGEKNSVIKKVLRQ